MVQATGVREGRNKKGRTIIIWNWRMGREGVQKRLDTDINQDCGLMKKQADSANAKGNICFSMFVDLGVKWPSAPSPFRVVMVGKCHPRQYLALLGPAGSSRWRESKRMHSLILCVTYCILVQRPHDKRPAGKSVQPSPHNAKLYSNSQPRRSMSTLAPEPCPEFPPRSRFILVIIACLLHGTFPPDSEKIHGDARCHERYHEERL